jgi:hypothetical protein
MTVTMERYLDHVVGHFEMGSTKSDWSHSNVIYGLLHQPIIYEAWKEYIAKRKSTFNGRKPMFGWGPASTGRARGFIEGETPGQLQDLLEFFDGTEASAQNIIRTAAAQVHVIMSAEPLSPEASAPPQAQQLLSRRTSNVQTPISVKSEALGLKQPIPSAFKQTIESESQTPRDSGYDEDIDTKEGSNMCRDPPSPQEELRDDMELVKVHPSSHCWTCTPPDEFSTDIVPLQLSGIPIVVPVQTQYPLYAPLVPPPDPHPLFADPTEPVTDKIIDEIFSVYEEALGFYLLINGMLQIIVPGDFDFEHALSHRPREFAGLQVSYIHESLASTASIASQTSLGASRLVAQAEPSTSTAIPTQPISSSTKPSLVRPSSSSMTIGSTVHASVKGSKSRERFEAHVGLMTKAGDKIYVTIPTHLVTDAVRGANPALIPGSTWMKDVQIFSSTRNKEVNSRNHVSYP